VHQLQMSSVTGFHPGWLGWQFRLLESKFLACRNGRNPEMEVFRQIPPE
jgi:hypothetical protein